MYSDRFVIVWDRTLRHHPFIHPTATIRRNGIASNRLVHEPVHPALVLLAIRQSHRVHRRVVRRQPVNEQNLDQIADFRADRRALQTLLGGLDAALRERCICVAAIHSLAPFCADREVVVVACVGARIATEIEVRQCGGGQLAVELAVRRCHYQGWG